eukprot:scaffold147585_cov33-Tisochrysis_lutea.AAC.4
MAVVATCKAWPRLCTAHAAHRRLRRVSCRRRGREGITGSRPAPRTGGSACRGRHPALVRICTGWASSDN